MTGRIVGEQMQPGPGFGEARATPRPMPRLAPVISTRFPASSSPLIAGAPPASWRTSRNTSLRSSKNCLGFTQAPATAPSPNSRLDVDGGDLARRPARKNDQPVGEEQRLFDVMGDEDDRLGVFAMNGAQLRPADVRGFAHRAHRRVRPCRGLPSRPPAYGRSPRAGACLPRCGSDRRQRSRRVRRAQVMFDPLAVSPASKDHRGSACRNRRCRRR